MFRLLLALLALALATSAATAGPRRTVVRHQKSTYTQQTPSGPITQAHERTTVRGPTGAAVDALAEVNAARALRGLPPFTHDPALEQAARTCAELRAKLLLAGHTANDFAALPPGVTAAAAGCGALSPSWGWGSCCTYDSCRYAGAAVVTGADGRRFMHLFVR